MSGSKQSKTGLRQKARYVVYVLVAFLVALALVVLSPSISPVIKSLVAWQQVQEQTLEVLHREQLNFLVTDRIVTQTIVESEENNLFLGKRHGYMIAKVSLYYGVDLGKVSREDISREGTQIFISIPDPEELTFSVDLESMRYLTKRSGLQVLTDWAMDRNQKAELRSQFKGATYHFLRQEDLLPERE
ncbi:MAG: DUF4230 domain-containing protein, partial [bacterium]